MPTSPTPSTPQPSSPLVKPPKISSLLPLPSTTPPIPSLDLPPPRSDVELPLRYFNTTGTPNSSASPFTTPENSRRRISLPSSHHELRPPSLTQSIPIVMPASSVIDTYSLPCNSHTSHIQDSSSSPTTFTRINNVARLPPPSSLPSFLGDIPVLYLPPALSEQWEKKTAPQQSWKASNRWQFSTCTCYWNRFVLWYFESKFRCRYWWFDLLNRSFSSPSIAHSYE